MPPMPHFFYRPNFWIELVYSLVLIITCTVIYLKTKEMYKLTSYRGINYFSKAFLFFALAYFFRFFFGFFFKLFFILNEFRPSMAGFRVGSIFFVFASTMAALYVLYSVIWKKASEKDFTLFLYAIAAIVTLSVDIFLNPIFHIIGIIGLFLAAIIINIIDARKVNERKQKKKQGSHSLSFAYVLILLFWLLNVVSLELPWFFLELKLIVYAISAGLFMIIAYRVIRIAK
ncbi:MAG: hypothetical protein V1859_06890 [archaeon]